jgi:hypothetical protein
MINGRGMGTGRGNGPIGMGRGMKAWATRILGSGPEQEGGPVPPNVRAEELTQLDGGAQQQLKEWGTATEVEGNPPAWVGDEATWERAKEAVEKHWENYDEPYAVVAHVYFNMGGTMA